VSIPEEPIEPKREPSQPERRDRPTAWSLILLALFLLLQVYSLTGSQPISVRLTGSKIHNPPAAASDASTDLIEGIISVDIEAKYAYFAGDLLDALSKYAQPSPPSPAAPAPPNQKNKNPAVKPASAAAPMPLGKDFDQKDLLANALKDATDLFRGSPTSVTMAHRVLLLRAEAGQPPLAPIPAKGKKPAISSPLVAFVPPPNLSVRDRIALAKEAALWKTLFSSPTLPKNADVPSLAAQIQAIPSLRWWGKLALHQLYLRSGNQAAANQALDNARAGAISTFVFTALIGLGQIAAALAGIVLWIVYLVNGASRKEQQNQRTYGQGSLLDTVPPRIADSERRLGFGDLLNLFVIYLLCLEGVALVVELVEAHWKHQIQNLPLGLQLDLSIAETAVAYLGGSFAAYCMLRAMANRRGASLGKELGLTVGGSLGRNVLFGVGGWSMALVLLFAVTFPARIIFRHAPAPANPAIPMLISASDLFSRLTLLLLVSVAAPFFEETFFRGVFFNALRQRFGPWPAIVLTGFMFGFVHPVGIAEVFSLAALGGVFAWMAEKRKSLAPTMTAHCLVNSMTFLTTMFTFMLAQPR
jgi:membrane protease YdiL (CAAX protease family)